MAVTVQMQFASVVTERYQDAFVGSSIENGTTVLQFDLRRHNVQQALGTQAFGGGYGVLAVYVVFLLALVLRPAGLLGRRLG